MKTIKILSLLSVLVILNACQTVTFTEPQPVGVANINSIPKLLQGKYIAIEDSSLMLIDEKIILHIYDFESTILANQLDSNLVISGDVITDNESNISYPFKRRGDTLIVAVNRTDTLLNLNSKDVVKKFKGHYFLNKFKEENKWEVKKIELSKGELIVNSISEDDLKNLESLSTITESPKDSLIPNNFTLTKKQFKDFVREGGFRDSQKYLRVKQ